jgi:hypothetical protein|tara:strand:- start:203 stop:451 length:249 start_codon:yes stop_codon:yes gene_type:complete
MSSNEETNVFEDMSIEELQETVQEMSVQLRDAKAALKGKRLSGVRTALDARREADVELQEELKKLGYAYRNTVFSDPFFRRF